MIDGKFIFEGHNPCTGKEVSHNNSFIIKASDPAALAICDIMMATYTAMGCQPEQVEGVRHLRDRVERYQEEQGIHKPDVNACEIERIIPRRPNDN